MRTLYIIFLILIALQAKAQQFPVDTIFKSGSIDNRINILILGDGFTTRELPLFKAEAEKFAAFFLNYEPYNYYKNYFNFFSIPTPSQESGISNPGTAPDAYPDQPVASINNFYHTTFGSSIHRLVTSDLSKVLDVAAINFPLYDLIVMLANTTYYGGSGGVIAVHTLNQSANKIGVHEIGHSFTTLKDEYWAGPQYAGEALNMTAISNPAQVVWKNWVNSSEIGVYKHGDSGDAAKWHKPAKGTCLMEYLDQPFCAVCREATTERILSIIDPVEKMQPDTAAEILVEKPVKFSLELLEPDPNTLVVNWMLNDQPIAADQNEIEIDPADFGGERKLTAIVQDETPLSRSETARKARTRTIQWKLKSNTPVLGMEDPARHWVTVSPNPAKERIEVKTDLSGTSVFQLVNSAGRGVINRKFEKETSILLRLPAGIYVYKLVNSARGFSGKVLIE